MHLYLFPAIFIFKILDILVIMIINLHFLIFRDGVLKPTQMGTQSMSMAVSELFWKMVRETVEQQADAFKGQTFVIHVYLAPF